jgi:delta8-fatty-acid desaturase
MGGKDCTDVFANYHPARVYKTMLPSYFVGDVVDYHVSSFVKGHRDLRQQLLSEGLFETKPGYYRMLYAWVACLWTAAVYFTV